MARTMSPTVKAALITAAATVIVAVVTMLWPRPTPPPPMLTIAGRIVDASQTPVGGASITATGEPIVTTSGTSGNFTFSVIASSVPASASGRTIQIRVDMRGYDSWTGPLQLPSSQNVIQLTQEIPNPPVPTPQIPEGIWSGNVPEIDTTTGGGTVCTYSVSFKNLATSFTISGGQLKGATLAYTYNDNTKICSGPSGIPDTPNQFALGSYDLGPSTLHLEFIQKSGVPAATAKLDAVLDGTSSMKGSLTITRTDSIGSTNWNIIQSVPLSR
jgi:hypothetical protein